MEKSEVGRIFSCLALISALVKFVSGPMYAIIYDQTLASFPGTFMMVTSLIIFMAMAIMMIVKCLIRYQGGEITGLTIKIKGAKKETSVAEMENIFEKHCKICFTELKCP